MIMNIQTSKNDERATVMELQIYLRRIAEIHPSIPLINPDGNYGSETEAAVSAFQKEFNLPVTGVVDYNTWNAIFAEYIDIVTHRGQPLPLDIFPPNTREITPRYTGDVVLVIQIMLRSIAERFQNLPPVTVTGVYDDQTVHGTAEFQKLSNLPATGNVDKNTWNRLTLTYRSYLYDEI